MYITSLLIDRMKLHRSTNRDRFTPNAGVKEERQGETTAGNSLMQTKALGVIKKK
ncbi:MAG: hypothetical protein JW908_09185 [Anaerolineales bacterium]|nr:hypothetical protein [Anaerolineales bacterium]